MYKCSLSPITLLSGRVGSSKFVDMCQLPPLTCLRLNKIAFLVALSIQYPIRLFIHYGDLHSASSRLLLRSAPEQCTAKENSFPVGYNTLLVMLRAIVLSLLGY